MNKGQTYQLLAELLPTLEREGFSLGVGQHLRVQGLLSRLPEELPEEQLKLALAPLFATNPQQQEQFYTLFEQCRERVRVMEAAPARRAALPPMERRWRRRALILGIATLLALAVPVSLWLYRWLAPPPQSLERPFDVLAGQTVEVCLDSTQLAAFDTIIAAEFCDTAGYRGALGNFEISDPACLAYTAGDSLGQDSICVRITDRRGRSATINFRAEVLRQVVVPPPPGAEVGVTSPLFIPKQEPPPPDLGSLAMEPPPAWVVFLAAHAWWLKPLSLLLLGLFLYALLRWLEQRRRRLVAELESGDKPPYVWNIGLGESGEDIELGEDFQLTLHHLRRRARTEQVRLHLPRTVEATIAKGGMADLQFEQQTQPPEYLLLIDRQDARNHRAQVFDRLYQSLRENEVLIERFYYNGDPRTVFNEAHAEGLPLKSLQQRFPAHRLLLMGSGYPLLSPTTGKLAGWSRVLEQWRQRALLTPQPAGAWGRKEERLGELLHVLPASLQGLRYLVDQLDAAEEADYDNWREQVQDFPREHIEFQGGLLATLEAYYPRELIRWIAACAVYPALHWGLTLYLGRLLSGEDQRLLTLGNLQALNRLPWFVEGAIPNEARAVLLAWLEEEEPGLLPRIRESLHGLLLQNPPPRDSAAWDDYHLNLSLNEWRFTRDKRRKKELERTIAAHLEQGAEADFTVVKYLDRPRGPLDFIVPERWKKYIHPGGHPALGWKGLFKDMPWAALLWLAFATLAICYTPRVASCGGAEVAVSTNDGELQLCLDSPADSLLYYEVLARDSVRRLVSKFGMEEEEITEPQTPLQVEASKLRMEMDKIEDEIARDTGEQEDKIAELEAELKDLKFKYKRLSLNIEGNRTSIYHLNYDGVVLSDGEIWEQLNPIDSINQLAEGVQAADSLRRKYRQNVALTLFNEGITLYDTYHDGVDTLGFKAAACACFTRAAALDTVDFDFKRARAWCEAKPPPANPYKIAPEIVGTMANEAGEPLSGVSVNGPFAGALVSDARGQYTLRLPEDYPRPDITLSFAAPGYRPANRTFAIDGVDQLPTTRLQPSAAPTFTLRGTVRDSADNRPLAGVTVTAPGHGTATTSAAGSFQLEVEETA
ncbi:MAG: hypothetical protein H6558_15620, partial [Lewinellaceae bacterium]|nr:hypothetical protein [Lewinellaceae bacterium]